MGIIVTIIIVILIIYFATKKSPKEKPVEQKIFFNPLSPEEQNARNETFDKLMQGVHGKELTQCYAQIKSLFVPKKNGDFAGSLSGLLSNSHRAKKLESTDKKVAQMLGNNTQEYAVWYNVLFDNLLNEMYFSNNGKLSQLTKDVIEDVKQGDIVLESIGIRDILANPEHANCSISYEFEDYKIKIKTETKNNQLYYKIKGAYESFRHGLCLEDDLIRKAEILIEICEKYEFGAKCKLNKEEIEKYALPNLQNINNQL